MGYYYNLYILLKVMMNKLVTLRNKLVTLRICWI